MQNILTVPLVLLVSLTVFPSLAGANLLTACAFAQSTEKAAPQPSLSTRIEGHYEGKKLDFMQDFGSSVPVAIDFARTGTCLYSQMFAQDRKPIWMKLRCHWERSADAVTVRVTQGETVRFHWTGDTLIYLKRDSIGGGVCIQLAKNKAASDPGADPCQAAMIGMPGPPR